MVSGTGQQNTACNYTVCYAVGRLGEGMALGKKLQLSTCVAEEEICRKPKLQDTVFFGAELLS